MTNKRCIYSYSNNRGITLVALVITIIVLLILAGVAIMLVIGDNGVLNQATKASEKTKNSHAREVAQMQIEYIEKGENVGKVDLVTTKSKIENLMKEYKEIKDVSDIVPATDDKDAYIIVSLENGENFNIYGIEESNGVNTNYEYLTFAVGDIDTFTLNPNIETILSNVDWGPGYGEIDLVDSTTNQTYCTLDVMDNDELEGFYISVCFESLRTTFVCSTWNKVFFEGKELTIVPNVWNRIEVDENGENPTVVDIETLPVISGTYIEREAKDDNEIQNQNNTITMWNNLNHLFILVSEQSLNIKTRKCYKYVTFSCFLL